jgi:hypothetical protein
VGVELGGPFANVPPLGTDGTTLVSRVLSVGTHSVSLWATDDEGLRAESSISVVVGLADQDPTAIIDRPTNLAVVDLGAELVLRGTVSDPNDPADVLDYSWSVSPQDSGTAATEVVASGTADPTGAADGSWSIPADRAVLGEWSATAGTTTATSSPTTGCRSPTGGRTSTATGTATPSRRPRPPATGRRTRSPSATATTATTPTRP